jgi:hypothetical protein
MGDQMGSIQIFALEIAGTRLVCAWLFSGGYRLQAGGFTFTMMPDAAGVLAAGGERIRLRAQVAARLGREMRAGSVFARNLLSTDGRTARVEIGVTDSGDVYLEIDAMRLTVDGQRHRSCSLFSVNWTATSPRSAARRSTRAWISA